MSQLINAGTYIRESMHIKWLLRYPITGSVFITTSRGNGNSAVLHKPRTGLNEVLHGVKGCCPLELVQHGIMSEACLVR